MWPDAQQQALALGVGGSCALAEKGIALEKCSAHLWCREVERHEVVEDHLLSIGPALRA